VPQIGEVAKCPVGHLCANEFQDNLGSIPSDVGETSLANQPPFHEDPDPRAQLFDFAEQVAGQEHGGAAACQRRDRGPNVDDADRIQTISRLVEDEERWRSAERQRESQPLAHAGRILTDFGSIIRAEPGRSQGNANVVIG
jgi:hypothetical protein